MREGYVDESVFKIFTKLQFLSTANICCQKYVLVKKYKHLFITYIVCSFRQQLSGVHYMGKRS